MLVLYKNEMYDLDMPWLLFESIKKHSPQYEVKMLQHTESSYKKETIAMIGQVEDYSVARNLNALGYKKYLPQVK